MFFLNYPKRTTGSFWFPSNDFGELLFAYDNLIVAYAEPTQVITECFELILRHLDGIGQFYG